MNQGKRGCQKQPRADPARLWLLVLAGGIIMGLALDVRYVQGLFLLPRRHPAKHSAMTDREPWFASLGKRGVRSFFTAWARFGPIGPILTRYKPLIQ
ncbi:hypothetical protein [Achromobacter sp. AGC39]